ncbi:MAG: ABC transporter ATP-binding protein [Promethearchaeota archaeon]|jgi:oligopeptide/dipeptide ABC transporter ATP-binding protein
MPLVNALVATVLLYFITVILNTNLQEEGRISRRIHRFSSTVSSLIIFGIIFSIRLLFEALGNFYIFEDYYIFRYLSTDAFLFAIMATIFLPVHAIFLKIFAKYKRDDDENTVQSAQFKGIYTKFIILAWIVGIIFLSIPLLQIPVKINGWMDLFNKSLDPDEFYLGFLWAIFSIGFAIIITYIVNQTRPIERRIPSIVLKKAMYTGGLTSFGIWSIQLVIVELYLGRFFNFYLYQQDIRVLILVVNAVYIAVFFITLRRIFQPQAVNRSQLRLQEALERYEKRKGKEIKSGGNHVILEVQDLTTYFYTEEGIVKAVEGVSFKINEGETLGLVGETGCGKSVTALSILQVVRPPGKIEKGKVIFRGEDLLQRSKSGVLDYRGKEITMIFQDPLNSLNPVFKIGAQITEVYLLHMENELLVEAFNQNKSIFAVAREWGELLLRDLNIPFPEVIFDRYPHELSGGMRQRVQIAMGLACKPHLLIADEPTTALDVTIQNQILKLMKELKTKFNASMLFITHDLGIISKMCDNVAVMYSGFIVENGDIKKLFVKPYHPYTRGLIGSVPVVGKKRRRLEVIEGTVPNLIYPPSGCRFHPRCNYCFEPCDSEIPRSIEVEQDYLVACHLYDPQYKELAEISIKNVEENN